MAAAAQSAAAENATAPAPKAFDKTKLLKIGIAVLGIVTAECVAAFLYLPRSPSEASAARQDDAELLPPEPEKASSPPEAALHEFNMGEYRVTAFQPLSNTTLRIDFHMFGMVLAGKEEEELTELFKAREKRLRDQVFVTIRGADLNDFTDAGLGLLKRRILETTNKTLGKPLVQSVVFSDFSFVEQ